MEIKKEKFLNIEEADNLQDMINFAASIKDNNNNNKKNNNDNNNNGKNKDEDINYIYPVESLYSKVMSNENLPNEKHDLDKEKLTIISDEGLNYDKNLEKKSGKYSTSPTLTLVVEISFGNAFGNTYPVIAKESRTAISSLN